MTVKIKLWTKSGNISLPGFGLSPFWGFASSPEGEPSLPGPVIELSQNDNLEAVLNNNLSVPVSIVFPGQEFTPQPVVDSSGAFLSYNLMTLPGEQLSYNLTPSRPGVFLYESGTSQDQQLQMGLFGIMVIRPDGYQKENPQTWTAYGEGTGTEFDIEKVLVIGEIDSKMRQGLAAGEVYPRYNPDYFIINGRSYPDSVEPDKSGSQPYSAEVNVQTGQRVLLRIINAGFFNHNLCLLGITARIVAEDSWPLKTESLDASYEKNTITLGSGQSYDLLFNAPAPGKYLLYDRDLNHAVNNNEFPGGIITIINVK